MGRGRFGKSPEFLRDFSYETFPEPVSEGLNCFTSSETCSSLAPTLHTYWLKHVDQNFPQKNLFAISKLTRPSKYNVNLEKLLDRQIKVIALALLGL